jgi:uncharacterized protein (DUF362 family)
MPDKISRRDFLIQSSAAIVSARSGARRRSGLPGNETRSSRVVEVHHPRAVLENRKIDAAAVQQMLRQGLGRLAGSAKPWADFVGPGDRVGLKVNTLGRPLLVTHHELVQAVIQGLLSAGVKENHIIVWDRWQHHLTAGGYALNISDHGVRCYGTEGQGVTAKRLDPDVFYESDFDTADQREGGTRSLFSSIFTRDCDKVVNLALLKDHDSSGYTMCLKNLAYGITTNNNRFHKPLHIGPFIAGICAHPLVARKTVLHIIDGLEACYDHGPVPDRTRFLFAPRTLWLGTDPVALDAVSRPLIDAERLRRGLPLLKDTPGFYAGMRPVDHVELAAAKGVGVADLGRIRVERVSVPA